MGRSKNWVAVLKGLGSTAVDRRCVQGFGGKAERKETTRKTWT
jgi:hypothetical protein